MTDDALCGLCNEPLGDLDRGQWASTVSCFLPVQVKFFGEAGEFVVGAGEGGDCR